MVVFDYSVVAGVLIILPSIGAWYDRLRERDAVVERVRANDILEGYKVAALKHELVTTDMTIDEFEQRLNALLVPALPKPIVQRVRTQRRVASFTACGETFIPRRTSP